MSKIKLNDKTGIDSDKLIESRLLIQANSGGGKSMTIRRFIEQSFGQKQIIVLDPEGEFANLREKFDFVYCGKGGDAPVESRSAALLAHRLLELKASAILDLYELPPQERKHFVKLFLEALVNAPKELWHDVYVILDEAHVFAPEKAESEALGAVIDLASRGRKRGYCLIPATQRPAKLNKDVAAECNNKLIGRASLDIDRKRAAEELGFTTKEQVLSLRDLEPGEFYAFGPAISREVIKIKVGDVQVKPPSRSSVRRNPPPPSAKVKEILAQLSDIPQEVEKELQNTQTLKRDLATAKSELTTTKRQLQTLQQNPQQSEPPIQLVEKAVKFALEKRRDESVDWEKRMITENNRMRRVLGNVMDVVTKALDIKAPTLEERQTISALSEYIDPKYKKKLNTTVTTFKKVIPIVIKPQNDNSDDLNVENSTIGKGEIAVLSALGQYPDDGLPREAITTITQYKRSTRDAYIKRLQDRGFVRAALGKLFITPEGVDTLGPNFEPLPTSGHELRAHLLSVLPKGEKEILSALLGERQSHSEFVSRDWLSEETSFKRSTRDAYIKRLIDRQLVESSSDGVRVVERVAEGL